MAADGLTKLAFAPAMEMLRQAMSANFPAVADPAANFTKQDANWWGCLLRAFAARFAKTAELALRRSAFDSHNQIGADPILQDRVFKSSVSNLIEQEEDLPKEVWEACRALPESRAAGAAFCLDSTD